MPKFMNEGTAISASDIAETVDKALVKNRRDEEGGGHGELKKMIRDAHERCEKTNKIISDAYRRASNIPISVTDELSKAYDLIKECQGVLDNCRAVTQVAMMKRSE